MSFNLDQFNSLDELVDFIAPTIVPAGTIMLYGGTSAPGGFILCDGSTVRRVQYQRLFAAIGTQFGEGDGQTTFGLPNTNDLPTLPAEGVWIIKV